jgi:hypothetical protein
LLMEGAEEVPEELPEDVPVLLFDEEDPATVVVVTEVEPVDPFVPAVFVLPAPECSCATTTPMATVAPVAARTAPRLNQRNRDVVLSRWRGALRI